MGFNMIKWLCKRFQCTSGSDCTFNVKNLPQDLLDIDLSKYQLRDEDLKLIWKIQKNRPSIYDYKHNKKLENVEI